MTLEAPDPEQNPTKFASLARDENRDAPRSLIGRNEMPVAIKAETRLSAGFHGEHVALARASLDGA